MEELNKSKNSSNNNEKNQLVIHSEKIKTDLLNILINSSYINDTNARNLHSLNDIANYMKSLIKDNIITEDMYMKICIQAWAIKLWQYLVYKELISKEQLNLILKEQKESIKLKDMNLWEILTEKKLIEFKDLAIALEEFLVIKLWEYLIWKSIINEYQLNMFIKTQKYKDLPLWKILINYGILNQEELNRILKEMWIKLNNSDFLTDEDEELDYYKIKE